MVRYRTDDGAWYFFQAWKQHGEWYVFEGKRMYKHWATTDLHGWVRLSGTEISAFPAQATFVDDAVKTSRSYRLAGILVLDDRIVWITVGSGYEWQWYELFEVRPGSRSPHSVLSVDAGGS